MPNSGLLNNESKNYLLHLNMILIFTATYTALKNSFLSKIIPVFRKEERKFYRNIRFFHLNCNF